MKMAKHFTVYAIFFLNFLSCPVEPGNETTPGNNSGNNDTSIIRIQNQSAATFVNMIWNGHSFNEGQAISPGGNTKIENAIEGHSYIFFNITGVGSEIALRTQALVTKDDQNLTFTFNNNTPIVKVSDESNIFFTIGSFLNSINNPDGLYLPSHNEIITALNALGHGITDTRILSYQLMQNLLWQNVLSGKENETVNLARDSKINIEVGFTGAVSPEEVTKILDNLFINFTSANIVVSGGMTFPLPAHLEIQRAVMALDGAGTTSDVVATDYLVNGSYIFAGYEIDRPHGAVIEITVRYTTTILTQARVRTEVTRIFASAGFNNITVNAAHW